MMQILYIWLYWDRKDTKTYRIRVRDTLEVKEREKKGGRRGYYGSRKLDNGRKEGREVGRKRGKKKKTHFFAST